jgi:predicted AAA+ superfamily ATPase
LREPLDGDERGRLLETWVFHELRAHVAYSGCGGELAYWRTPSGGEVDFVWSRGSVAVGIEVKASPRWRSEDGRSLKEMTRAGVVKRCFAVYTGDRPLLDQELKVLPVADFLRALTEGGVIGR